MNLMKKPKIKEATNKPGAGIIKKTKISMKPIHATVEELITCLNLTLPKIQRFHWNSTSYAEHEALGELYGCLQAELDCLAEQYVLCCGPISAPTLYVEYDSIKKMMDYTKRKVADAGCDDRGINATIDNINIVLNKACYKLERLK